MKLCKNFDYEKRYGDDILGYPVPWTMALAGPHGAHYHFWLPKCDKGELKMKQEGAMRAARRMGDPVSFSYDFLEGENGHSEKACP